MQSDERVEQFRETQSDVSLPVRVPIAELPLFKLTADTVNLAEIFHHVFKQGPSTCHNGVWGGNRTVGMKLHPGSTPVTCVLFAQSMSILET